MPLHMRMPKHGFKSRRRQNKIILKTDFFNILVEKKIIKESSTLTIDDLINHSNSKQNVYIKLLLGKKLSKAVNIESHAVSESAKKEFERVGGTINIVKFKKTRSKVTKDSKVKKITKEKINTSGLKKNKLEKKIIGNEEKKISKSKSKKSPTKNES